MVLNRQKRENFKPGNQLISSEAARGIEPKAPQPLNFSRVQVGVPLSSKCPNFSREQSKLSLQLFFAHRYPNENLYSPHLCSTSDEAFTSKMNGARASPTHWTSFKHKPPQPIVLAERPLRALLQPPGEPKARAQRKAHVL